MCFQSVRSRAFFPNLRACKTCSNHYFKDSSKMQTRSSLCSWYFLGFYMLWCDFSLEMHLQNTWKISPFSSSPWPSEDSIHGALHRIRTGALRQAGVLNIELSMPHGHVFARPISRSGWWNKSFSIVCSVERNTATLSKTNIPHLSLLFASHRATLW